MNRGVPLCGLLFVASGCGCGDTEFVGGSAATLALAQQILRSFQADSLQFHVCSVKIRSSVTAAGSGRVDSYYDSLTRVVHIDETPPGTTFSRALTHELCHAVNLQNNLSRRSDALWPVDPLDPAASGGHHRAEAFASWCELGVDALALSDRPGAISVLEEAFPGVDLPRLTVRRGPTTGWPIESGWLASDEDPSPLANGAVRISLVTLDLLESQDLFLDAETCTPVADPGLALPQIPVAAPDPWVTSESQGAVGEGGARLASATLSLPDSSVDPAWLLSDNGAWSRVQDGEPGQRTHVVVAKDGVLFGVEADPLEIRCWKWLDLPQL